MAITYNRDKSITLNGWQQGIADSPLFGFEKMENVNVGSIPGALQANYRHEEVLQTRQGGDPSNATFTADASTDRVTPASVPTTVFFAPVTVSSTGTLPGGLSSGTTYYIGSESGGAYRIYTSLTNAFAGTFIDITSAGTGTHTMNFIYMSAFAHIEFVPKYNCSFALDSAQRVWVSIPNSPTLWLLLVGNTLTQSTQKGMVYWKDNLFVFRDTQIDVMTITSLTSSVYNFTWDNGWETIYSNVMPSGSGISNNKAHSAMVGLDDAIYFLSGLSAGIYYIGSIRETSGPFDPANAATYSFNAEALDIPKQPLSLSELGINLMIGTVDKEIYPWDRKSPSFSIPVICNEKVIWTMVARNNLLYVFAGYQGNIYTSNGSTTSLLRSIPDSITNFYYTSGKVSFGRATILNKKIIFTVAVSTSPALYFIGSIVPETNTLLVENNLTSVSTLNTVEPISERAYQIGSNANQYVSGSALYANYEPYIISELFTVGTPQETATLNQIEVELAKPIASGMGIRISYRTALEASWTQIIDITNTNYPAMDARMFGSDDFSAIEGLVDLQLKIELDTNGGLTNSPCLKQIRLVLN